MPNPQTQDPPTSPDGALAPSIQARRARAQQWFESLQQRVCAELEQLEAEATARFSPEMAKTMPGADKDPSYVSASISLIVHPRSPRVPTVHMNTRFLSTAESWFGGGADLTPMLDEQRSQEADDTKLFHAAMQAACDPFDPEWYPRYKAWCDEYFFLPHRNEPRGIGGIFYDRHNSGDFERDFAFTRAVGEAFLDVYPKIVRA